MDEQQPTATIRQAIYSDIEARCARNIARWGDRRTLTDLLWFNVLGEEFGEVAEPIHLGGNNPAVRPELVDLAAVAVAMLEAIDDGRFVRTSYVDNNATPLAIVSGLAHSFGIVARAILEQQDADTVREALVAHLQGAAQCLRDTYLFGYEPREIEGEDDQEARSPAAQLSFAATAYPEAEEAVAAAPRMTVPLSDVLRALPGRDEDHEWLINDFDSGSVDVVQHYFCPNCASTKRMITPEIDRHGVVAPPRVEYRRIMGGAEWAQWRDVVPPCRPEGLGE